MAASDGSLTVSAELGGKGQPSLQQRRMDARRAQIRRARETCRAIAEKLAAVKKQPCVGDDRLDERSGICLPRRNMWQPYQRWDPAAGRCKPRDRFVAGVCVGPRERYQPNRRFAQRPSQSVQMYGRASAMIEASLDQCHRTLNALRQAAGSERTTNERYCRQARQLGRADLERLYCR